MIGVGFAASGLLFFYLLASGIADGAPMHFTQSGVRKTRAMGAGDAPLLVFPAVLVVMGIWLFLLDRNHRLELDHNGVRLTNFRNRECLRAPWESVKRIEAGGIGHHLALYTVVTTSSRKVVMLDPDYIDGLRAAVQQFAPHLRVL